MLNMTTTYSVDMSGVGYILKYSPFALAAGSGGKKQKSLSAGAGIDQSTDQFVTNG